MSNLFNPFTNPWLQHPLNQEPGSQTPHQRHMNDQYGIPGQQPYMGHPQGYPGANPYREHHMSQQPGNHTDAIRIQELQNAMRQHSQNPLSPTGRDVINVRLSLHIKNYLRVIELSGDPDLAEFYLLDSEYTWRLLMNNATNEGTWFEDKVFVILQQPLLDVNLSTPRVTITINRLACKVISKTPDKPLTDDDIYEGVLPILRYIRSVYDECEEKRRQEELNRLKESERLKEITDQRDALYEKLNSKPKRDLEDTKNRTPKGQIKKNTVTEMNTLSNAIAERVVSGRQLINTTAKEMDKVLRYLDGNYFAASDLPGGAEAGIFLKADKNSNNTVTIITEALKFTLIYPGSNVEAHLHYSDVTSEDFIEDLRIAVLAIKQLLQRGK